MNNPNVTCVIGGQYGSEGKGLICAYLAPHYYAAVRIGAPNAGHSVIVGKKIWKMRQIPVAGLINPDILLFIGAAGLINMDVLMHEMKQVPHCASRLYIDRNAGILEHKHIELENFENMNKKIGSTCEGVGAALRDKIKRNGTFKTAKDIPELKPFVINVSEYLNTIPTDNKIMIEGTQGTELSLNHGPYPFCTSRDIIAASLLSDVGLSPFMCEEIIMVVRTYPIRVAGNSGPMCGKEISWKEVTKRSKSPKMLNEQTTVTKRTRRVCEFDMALVKKAAILNKPTQLALTFVDYINHDDYGKTEFDRLSAKSKEFIHTLEKETNTPVTLIKTGPDIKHIIDLTDEYLIYKRSN